MSRRKRKNKKKKNTKVWADQGTSDGDDMEEVVKKMSMKDCVAQLFTTRNGQPKEFLGNLGPGDDASTIQRDYGCGHYAIMVKNVKEGEVQEIIAKKLIRVAKPRPKQDVVGASVRKLNIEKTESEDSEV